MVGIIKYIPLRLYTFSRKLSEVFKCSYDYNKKSKIIARVEDKIHIYQSTTNAFFFLSIIILESTGQLISMYHYFPLYLRFRDNVSIHTEERDSITRVEEIHLYVVS